MRGPSKSDNNREGHSSSSTLDGESLASFALECIKIGLMAGLTYYLTQQLISRMTGNDETSKADRQSAQKDLAKRLKRPEIEHMVFDEHESKLLIDIIGTDEINVGFNDVGGMMDQVEIYTLYTLYTLGRNE